MKLLKHLGIAFLFMAAMFPFLFFLTNLWHAVFSPASSGPADIYEFIHCVVLVLLFLFGLILSKLHEIHKAILNKDSADPDTLFIDRDQNPKGD